jgi:DNA-binding NarL/FixJ family response regulator
VSDTDATRAMTGQGPIRVMVADDEETVVDVLRALVGSDPSLRFVGSANDAEQAIEMVLRERPDVVLLDVRMPGGGGIRAAREIRRRSSPTKIVALSAHDDADTVIGMIGAGANGYVPKGDSTDKILRTIHRATDGRRRPIPPRRHLSLAPAPPRHDERAANVARAIIDGAVTAEFAPIVEVDSGRTVGLEVRPHVATLPHRSYDAWCADAQAVGVLMDLELAAFREGRLALRRLPDDMFLEFEVSPFTASEARFRRSIQKTIAGRISLGFSPLVGSGGVRINDVNFAETLQGLRSRGIRVTATDAGTGLDGLGHLASLAPDFVRLDTSLTRSVATSFSNHSIVAAVVGCAAQIGAQVIAPDVRSERQLEELQGLGVHLVQGPLVGEMVFLSELAERIGALGRDSGKRPSLPMPSGEVSPSSTATPGGGAS